MSLTEILLIEAARLLGICFAVYWGARIGIHHENNSLKRHRNDKLDMSEEAAKHRRFVSDLVNSMQELKEENRSLKGRLSNDLLAATVAKIGGDEG